MDVGDERKELGKVGEWRIGKVGKMISGIVERFDE